MDILRHEWELVEEDGDLSGYATKVEVDPRWRLVSFVTLLDGREVARTIMQPDHAEHVGEQLKLAARMAREAGKAEG